MFHLIVIIFFFNVTWALLPTRVYNKARIVKSLLRHFSKTNHYKFNINFQNVSKTFQEGFVKKIQDMSRLATVQYRRI